MNVSCAEALARLPDGQAKQAGMNAGEQAARTILAARANDGSADAQGPYVPTQAAGAYRFTPPFDFAVFVGWGAVKPFTMTSTGQFRVAAPSALTDPGYTADFNEVKALGEARSSTRRCTA